MVRPGLAAGWATGSTGGLSAQAPAAAGTARGPSNQIGVEGGAITFPEVRLRLPTVELPSLFRGRKNAKMILEGTEAPWQSTGFVSASSAQNEQILQQQVAALQQQLAQASAAAPASGRTQAEAAAAIEAAERFTAASQQELEALRCEANRLRALEAAVREYQQRAQQYPDCQYWGPNGNARKPPVPSGEQYVAPPDPKDYIDHNARYQPYPAKPVGYADLPAHRLPQAPVIREPNTSGRANSAVTAGGNPPIREPHRPAKQSSVVREPQAKAKGAPAFLGQWRQP